VRQAVEGLHVDYPVAVDNDRTIWRAFHNDYWPAVLGPGADGRPVRFKVRIDGNPAGADHGADVDDQGNGGVTSQRLHQLVRQHGAISDRTFEIEFLDPGVQAFAFTFG